MLKFKFAKYYPIKLVPPAKWVGDYIPVYKLRPMNDDEKRAIKFKRTLGALPLLAYSAYWTFLGSLDFLHGLGFLLFYVTALSLSPRAATDSTAMSSKPSTSFSSRKPTYTRTAAAGHSSTSAPAGISSTTNSTSSFGSNPTNPSSSLRPPSSKSSRSLPPSTASTSILRSTRTRLSNESPTSLLSRSVVRPSSSTSLATSSWA